MGWDRRAGRLFVAMGALIAGGCGSGGGHGAVDPNPGITPTTLTRRWIGVDDAMTGRRVVETAPGEAHEVRSLAGVPDPADTGARSLAYWWVWSDAHMIDEELPARTGFFDSRTLLGGLFDAGFRPQEDLSLQLLNATILTANEVMRDYGRPFDLSLGLGDCSDNGSGIEVEWLLDVFDGRTSPGAPAGYVRPDTGDLDVVDGFNRGRRNFGTQEAFDPFDRPGMPNSNADFPVVGLRDPRGRPIPWFSAGGNHDALNVGNFPIDGSPIDDPQFNNFLFDGATYTGANVPFGYLLGLPNLVFDTIANAAPPKAFYDMLGGPDVGALFSNPVIMAFLLAFASDGDAAVRAETDPHFA
ncbi:MAG: hypothetical protein KC466_19565, partial [Myxococcales bacterium]|nr:hypothetical protein [Myxococcales bacterium]